MERKTVTVKISMHATAANIVLGLQNGIIDLKKDSLRSIGLKIDKGNKSPSAQQIKHHMEQLVKLGIIQKIYGEYVYYKP